MTAEEAYRQLVEGASAGRLDAFDLHVTASIMALSLREARDEGRGITEATGLGRGQLCRLAGELFPRVAFLILEGCEGEPEHGEDEACLIDLLTRCGTKGTPFEAMLAVMLARRAQRPNHLWQDLGLQDRDELSLLMTRHFAPLARRNDKNMKWKKFLYRTICRDVGYSLCVAPSCSECTDFELCFEAEGGESFLARIRRDADLAAGKPASP